LEIVPVKAPGATRMPWTLSRLLVVIAPALVTELLLFNVTAATPAVCGCTVPPPASMMMSPPVAVDCGVFVVLAMWVVWA
jgi:hypothetical protein